MTSVAVPRLGVAGHNLRASARSFVGRHEQIAEIVELLEGPGLVTLTGPPGIGKSRLALEVAAERSESHPSDAAVVVELAPVVSPALVPGALAAALSVQEVSGRSLADTLFSRLHDRRLLLVLDNCEHLVDACAELVEQLLRCCPKLRIVATSREPLKVAGERAYHVPALSLPGHEATLDGSTEAVRLFVERASAVQPAFRFNSYVAPAVAEICRRLDGVPLAIEMAAARVEMLTPAQIARRLDDRFSLLTSGSRGMLSRHQTLEAALELSHGLLAASERVLLRRLSVFTGGFPLDAAVHVTMGGELERGEVPGLVERLVAKSLVTAESGDSSPRYRLLETIRAYASARLDDARETAAVRGAHARYHLTLAEQAELQLTGSEQEDWLARLEAERADLRSALEWWLGHGDSESALRLASALVLYWRVRCHFSEGRDLLLAVLAATDDAPTGLRAKVLWGAGFLTLMAGDPEGAIPALQQSLSHSREIGDLQGCARALLILGNCNQYCDESSVQSLLEQSAGLAREAGDAWCLAHALAVAGFQYAGCDELAAARPLLEESVAVARGAEDKQGIRIGLLGLGMVSLRQGDYPVAQDVLEQALVVSQELGENYARATGLHYLGRLAFARGDYASARLLLAEAVSLLREEGPRTEVPEPLVALARVARAEGDHSGARLLLEEALSLAGTGAYEPAVRGMGELAAQAGEPGRARRLLEDALELGQLRGKRDAIAHTLHGLGGLARAEGALKRASILHNEAAQLQREIGTAHAIVASIEALAGLEAVSRSHAQAARLFGATQALRTANDYARTPCESDRYRADVALAREGLGSEAFAAAFGEGSRLSLEEAAAEASGGRRRQARPASGWSSVTEREREVAALAAEGLTNLEIAQRLFISFSTVKARLSSIYSKLGVAERNELAREVRLRDRRPSGDA